MKGAKRYMKVIDGFSENFFRANGPFYLKFSAIKGAKRYIKIYSSFFHPLIQGNWAILVPKMTYHQNSKFALTICLIFCTMKGANRYMEIIMTCPHNSGLNNFLKNFAEWKGPKDTSKLYYCLFWKILINGSWVTLGLKIYDLITLHLL